MSAYSLNSVHSIGYLASSCWGLLPLLLSQARESPPTVRRSVPALLLCRMLYTAYTLIRIYVLYMCTYIHTYVCMYTQGEYFWTKTYRSGNWLCVTSIRISFQIYAHAEGTHDESTYVRTYLLAEMHCQVLDALIVHGICSLAFSGQAKPPRLLKTSAALRWWVHFSLWRSPSRGAFYDWWLHIRVNLCICLFPRGGHLPSSPALHWTLFFIRGHRSLIVVEEARQEVQIGWWVINTEHTYVCTYIHVYTGT